MKIFTAAFSLSILAMSIISCNPTPEKKDAEKLNVAADSSNAVKYQLVTNAINSPVQMVAPPDNTDRLFISDLSGKIFILKDGKLLPKPFIDVSSILEQKDTSGSMRAIFSMAFHPGFTSNKKFYICYNAPASDTSDKCKLMISEFRASNNNPDLADLSTRREVLEVNGSTVGVDGCQISFGPDDGYLYVAVGDNGTPLEKREAQHLNSYLGKLLRIDVNKKPYGIPADNPFVNNKNSKPEIWSYGLRRLWRFSFDPQTHILLGADVGDKTEEEIDIIQKGGNYGWPVKEGDSLAVKNIADTSGFIAPINTYSHKYGICIIGGSIYHGNEIPFLQNRYVFADFNGSLFTLTKDSNQKWTRQPLTLINPSAGPLTIFSVDKDKNNELYVLGVQKTKAGSKGAIYKLVHS